MPALSSLTLAYLTQTHIFLRLHTTAGGNDWDKYEIINEWLRLRVDLNGEMLGVTETLLTHCCCYHTNAHTNAGDGGVGGFKRMFAFSAVMHLSTVYI